jgi:hypothetical protein
MTIRMTVAGPIFDGRADAALRAYMDDAAIRAADMVASEIRQLVHGAAKHPTGAYESQVVTTRMSEGARVHDSNVVYGPWLEGRSRRNVATRFRGYHAFRLASAQLQSSRGLEQMLQEDLRRYVGRME